MDMNPIALPAHLPSHISPEGIISTLAFSYSPGYYAAGSLTPASRVSDNIALFNESALEPVLLIGGVAEWEKGGVTQVCGGFQPSLSDSHSRRNLRIIFDTTMFTLSIQIRCGHRS